MNPNLILPIGTQVVTLVDVRERNGGPVRQAGSVGKIVKAPLDNTHHYIVQFPDGSEARLQRHEIAIRKQVQSVTFDRVNDPLSDRDLYQYVIYRCIVGSRAYGLDTADSDIDRRGIFLPPAEMHWSLYGVPEQVGDTKTDECYWELQKFLMVALKGNPNILEVLYSPIVEEAAPVAQELLANRSRFLSKLVYQTYNGYVLSQFRKLEQDLRTRGELKWKHVMHLLRLLISGIRILNEGEVPVHTGPYRERLLAVRHGELEWDRANEWRLELHKEFDTAFGATKLPERPDYEWCNRYLIEARRSVV